MKLVLTKRLLGIPVKVVTVELPDVSVSVSVTASVAVGSSLAPDSRPITPTHPHTP